MARNGRGLPITERQLEILAYVASGSTIDEAAAKCHIAPQSAYNSLGSARSKVGAATITHLAVIALENGWLERDGRRYQPAARLQAV